MRSVAGCVVLGILLSASPGPSFTSFAEAFAERYAALAPDPFALDMRERLRAVPDEAHLAEQRVFFAAQAEALKSFDRQALRGEERLLHDLIAYEIGFQLKRIGLEERWIKAGRPMPEHSLADLPDGKAWYALFVQRFTGTEITPEEVFKLGERETARCLSEIRALRLQMGYADSAVCQQQLLDDRFVIREKSRVIEGFARIDSTVREHLYGFVGAVEVPPVRALEWPDAGPNTPPGMYVSREEDTSLNADVFLFNFNGGRCNSRAMSWIYLHEAIPGHHLQSSVRRRSPHHDLREHLQYPGNFEGWACYVEYYGDELGVYADPYQRLGKWEWDLVRSVRLVMDAGIHYYGWTQEHALKYWKEHIPGQDAIAEREVRRVTNWAAQALSYKVGADRLQRMRDAEQLRLRHRFRASDFHRRFLHLGMVPIQVAEGIMADMPADQ